MSSWVGFQEHSIEKHPWNTGLVFTGIFTSPHRDKVWHVLYKLEIMRHGVLRKPLLRAWTEVDTSFTFSHFQGLRYLRAIVWKGIWNHCKLCWCCRHRALPPYPWPGSPAVLSVPRKPHCWCYVSPPVLPRVIWGTSVLSFERSLRPFKSSFTSYNDAILAFTK